MITFKQYLGENRLVDKVGRSLKVKTTKGSPDHKSAPKWATHVGKTPDGAYHWLSNDTPVEHSSSDNYFPHAKRTKFTGYVADKSKTGSVEKINK